MMADGHEEQGLPAMDPVRWRDDEAVAPAARLLVQAVRRPQPARPNDLARLQTAVGDITAVSDRRGWSSWRFIAAAAAIVVTFSTLGVAFAVWRTRQTGRPSLLPARTTTASATATRPTPTIAPIAPIAPTELPAHSPAAAPHARVHRHPLARPTTETTVDSLDQETSFVSQARALAASAPEDALALLVRHRRTFPDGQLGAERELLTVEVLVRLGHLPEASERAAALSSRYPTSSYSARAARLLREAPSPSGNPMSHPTSADAVPIRTP